ncbi:sulfotransferase family protein [Hydrocarboniphaga sp.]|uniref:sulfotransferase family protein n=1 Tax=Hydrocarboniphaga sp. TaxID=2033016 RepID=UPI003D150852
MSAAPNAVGGEPGASRPLLLRALNRVGRAAARPRLDAGALIARAERATGLRDWGDYEFREGLEVLTRSLEQEAQLNTIGRLMLRDYLHRTISNRLLLRRDLLANPQIAQVEIKRPLFIVGLPRTGSTMLQRLLARDPAVRSLQTWEMMHPSPPPEAATYDSDPRIKQVARRLKTLDWMAPDFATAHELVAGEPEECVGLLQTTMATSAYELMARIPSYEQWFDQQDLRKAYADYRAQLQHLQWQHPKDHWVLKSPFHIFGLEALLATFPDAVIVQTHRDPSQVLPSLCSLYSVMHSLTSDHASMTELGPHTLARTSAVNDRTIDLRERIGDARFVDIGYRALISDPLKAVGEIYERFGYDFTPAAQQAMRDWKDANPQHKRGKHQYTLEQFGLTGAAVDRHFARYKERFQQHL